MHYVKEYEDDDLADVEIMRNSDRVTRTAHRYGMVGLWSLGNAACDCYRASRFAEEGGEESPDIPCSDNLYSVRITSRAGKLLYSDGEFGFFDQDGKVPT